MWWLHEPFQIIHDYSFGEYSEIQIELLSWVVTFLWIFIYLFIYYFFLPFWVWVFCLHLPFPLGRICYVHSCLCFSLCGYAVLVSWGCCRYHELAALKQHKFILSQSWKPEFEIKVSAGCARSEDSLSCFFRLLLTPGVPWPVFTSWPHPCSLCLLFSLCLLQSTLVNG